MQGKGLTFPRCQLIFGSEDYLCNGTAIFIDDNKRGGGCFMLLLLFNVKSKVMSRVKRKITFVSFIFKGCIMCPVV